MVDSSERVVLISGGIDSTILAHFEPEAERVFVDYGQQYAKQEEQAVQNIFGGSYEKVSIGGLPGYEDIFVPNRNLGLAAIVSMGWDPDEIYIAGLRDDNVVDKNPRAYQKMSELLSEFAKHEVKVKSPFFDRTKGEVIEEFRKKFSDAGDILRNTYSCYNGVLEGCGDCPACFRKWAALESAGIKWKKPSQRIIDEYLAKLHEYDSNRVARTLIALGNYYEIRVWDIDGTVTKAEPEDPVLREKESVGRPSYRVRKPRKEVISQINDFDGITILYSARLETDREITERWLEENGVEYDALFLEKLPADVYYDDKAKEVI